MSVLSSLNVDDPLDLPLHSHSSIADENVIFLWLLKNICRLLLWLSDELL